MKTGHSEGLIRGGNTADQSITEGRGTYDIRFRAIVPSSGALYQSTQGKAAQLKQTCCPSCYQLAAAHKKDRLESAYGIPATEELDKEMKQMCNYSDYVEQIGIEKGMEKGRQKGLVETCREPGVSKDITLDKLMAEFALTQSTAEELLNYFGRHGI